VRLDRANGPQGFSNSWPRWSPDNGTFRGKRLYWVAFSSRRAYGLQVNNGLSPAQAKPQLWFAGVATGDEFQGDPSFAPVWLPNQNSNQSIPNGNHVPSGSRSPSRSFSNGSSGSGRRGHLAGQHQQR